MQRHSSGWAKRNAAGAQQATDQVQVHPADQVGVATGQRGHAGPLLTVSGPYENICRMAYLRGPKGIIVLLAERIG